MIVNIDNEDRLKTGLEKAADVIISGGIVAFPTESFYGLAVNIMDEGAIRRLFSIKKRSMDHPILILIPSIESLYKYVILVPESARRLVREFWPGGLTLILNAGLEVSSLLTSGTGKIGVRLSSHPVATSLARAVGMPITGTSANVSSLPACLTGEEVFKTLGKEVDLILDGGKTEGGMGSTILDVTVDPPKVLREGMVGLDRLKGFIQKAQTL